MSDHKPSEPGPNDFQESAHNSEDAGIADEGAAYTRSIEKEDPSELEAHPS